MTGRHRSLGRAALAALALLTAACDGGAGGAAPAAAPAGTRTTGVITVAAAASLTAPFNAIGDAFERASPGVEVRFALDSSSALARQITSGAPADVFASADDASMQEVTGAGLVAGVPRHFARNRLAIVVARGNPAGVRSLADLAGVNVVSLCGATVPCGRYAEQILQDAGVSIPTGRISRGQNAKATLTAVSDGDADAGIVYATDITGDGVDAVAIPEAQHALADYPIAAVRTSADPVAAAAFVAFVLGPEGQAAMSGAGFLAPG